MPKLSIKQVEHVAKLARLGMSKEEKKKFQKELSSILDYVNKLSEVDTKNVEPIAQITGLTNVVQEDKSRPSTEREKLLKNAPQTKDGYVKVKAILK